MTGSDFHLLDMSTQFEELEVFLRGTTLKEKEDWIATQGELIPLTGPHFHFPHYQFTSKVGLFAPFGIRGDEIVVFGDHCVIQRKKEPIQSSTAQRP